MLSLTSIRRWNTASPKMSLGGLLTLLLLTGCNLNGAGRMRLNNTLPFRGGRASLT